MDRNMNTMMASWMCDLRGERILLTSLSLISDPGRNGPAGKTPPNSLQTILTPHSRWRRGSSSSSPSLGCCSASSLAASSLLMSSSPSLFTSRDISSKPFLSCHLSWGKGRTSYYLVVNRTNQHSIIKIIFDHLNKKNYQELSFKDNFCYKTYLLSCSIGVQFIWFPPRKRKTSANMILTTVWHDFPIMFWICRLTSFRNKRNKWIRNTIFHEISFQSEKLIIK